MARPLGVGTEKPRVVVSMPIYPDPHILPLRRYFRSAFQYGGGGEADLIGTAAGLPRRQNSFASTFAVFATGRAYDQIRNSVAYSAQCENSRQPFGDHRGGDGASHQALEDISLMRSLPGMTVLVPADAPEAYRATLAAAAWDGPVYLRLGRPKVPVLPSGAPFQIGRGLLLKNGSDICLISTGSMTAVALKAAEILSSQGIGSTLIHLSTIKPLDKGIIMEGATRTGAVITLEEHSVIGGLGSAVAEVLGEYRPTPLKRIGVEDCFGQSGTPEILLEHYGLTPSRVAAAAGEMVKNKGS